VLNSAGGLQSFAAPILVTSCRGTLVLTHSGEMIHFAAAVAFLTKRSAFTLSMNEATVRTFPSVTLRLRCFPWLALVVADYPNIF
jgi:hypothetical protein